MTMLSKLIAHVESNDNPFAMRFEPHVYRKASEGLYDASRTDAQAANRCSRATASVIIASSWGKYQIMGFNLYGNLAITIPVIQYCSNVDRQELEFDKFVRSISFHASEEVEVWDEARFMKFARAYNGPGAPAEYVSRMKEVLKEIGV